MIRPIRILGRLPESGDNDAAFIEMNGILTLHVNVIFKGQLPLGANRSLLPMISMQGFERNEMSVIRMWLLFYTGNIMANCNISGLLISWVQ